ncbi:MAG: hypothetical protein J7599_14590 [Niabella sp.]|nr:hypothetical protein [Niabella sp.]
MTQQIRKSFLKLQIIWKDNDMLELQVIASNTRYYGTTEVYDTSTSLFDFAQTLIGFPKDNNHLFYETGYKESYAFFSMKFYCIDNSGHAGVEINLEENVATEFRPEEKHKLRLEIIVEPNAIDNFQKELVQLAKKQEGTAVLYGRDN